MSPTSGRRPVRLQVPPEAAGERLDRHLAERLDEPRNQVQRWIREGRVLVDGRPAKPSAPLAGGEQIEAHPPPPEPSGIEPEAGELRVLHQDPALIVIDKPAGLAVHPGAGRPSGTLVHRLLARFPELEGVGGPGRPGIVHRLDKDTSGVLVVARTHEAYRALQAAFAARQVEKRYLAVVYGAPEPPRGEISGAIGRHPERRKQMTVRPDGRPALTRFRTVAATAGIALLEIDLATGRTHQIRVHLKHLGHPIVGDPVYGEARWKGLPGRIQGPLRAFGRPALHAWRLALGLPQTGERLAFEAPVPRDLRRLWQDVTGEPFPARDSAPGG